MTQDQVLDCSFEWLREVEAGLSSQESRRVVKLSQAIASMFDTSKFVEMQQRLIDDY